jgi:hypothetical protein
MPRDPQGRKRPADVIGNAVLVMKLATGQVQESATPDFARAKGGKIGGKRRAATLSPERRAEIAKKAAKKRWGK